MFLNAIIFDPFFPIIQESSNQMVQQVEREVKNSLPINITRT